MHNMSHWGYNQRNKLVSRIHNQRMNLIPIKPFYWYLIYNVF